MADNLTPATAPAPEAEAAATAPAQTQPPTTTTQISEVTGLPKQTPQKAIVQGPVQVDVSARRLPHSSP